MLLSLMFFSVSLNLSDLCGDPSRLEGDRSFLKGDPSFRIGEPSLWETEEYYLLNGEELSRLINDNSRFKPEASSLKIGRSFTINFP